MAWQQADLDAIESAIASGAKRVRFQTHEVEYQSVSEMLRVRDLIKAEISPNPSNSRATVARFYRGLSCD
jgi:hypothetical protein